MLPSRLNQVRVMIEGKKGQLSTEEQGLLEELIFLDNALDKIFDAQRVQETARKISGIGDAFWITTPPSDVCNCCGRKVNQ